MALGRLLALACCCVPIPALAGSDPTVGRHRYEVRCGGCHAEDAHRVGPAHRGVLGRRAGRAPGYEYSPALAASSVVWTEATLDRWLTDPEALIPGQRMNYMVAKPADRASLIAYLTTLAAPAANP